jgi:hypothetical protein
MITVLAFESRQASLIGRREVLTGKAKFGIFGDGKEVAQMAMAKAFRAGDWRAGLLSRPNIYVCNRHEQPERVFRPACMQIPILKRIPHRRSANELPLCYKLCQCRWELDKPGRNNELFVRYINTGGHMPRCLDWLMPQNYIAKIRNWNTLSSFR